MQNIIKSMYLLGLLCFSNLLMAQHCNNTTWQWWKEDSQYWVAKTNPIDGAPLTNLKKPFHDNLVPSKLLIIQTNRDYTPQKGWELVYRDFGCGGANENPFFILYNKYSGIMRVFVYGTLENANGYAMRMKAAEVGRKTAFNAFARFPAYTPDRYLSKDIDNQFYESVYVGGRDDTFTNNWIVGEFRPAFDPNLQAYTDALMTINIFKVTDWALNARIGAEDTEITNDISFTGPAISSGGGGPGEPFSIIAGAGTVMAGFVLNKEAVLDTLIREKLTSAQELLNKAGIDRYDPLIEKITLMNNLKNAGKTFIQDLIKNPTPSNAIFGILSVMGNAMGVFGTGADGDEAGSLSVSNANQIITGSIKAEFGLVPISLKVPGTRFTAATDNRLPYYDCAYGVANLSNVPEVETKTFKWKLTNVTENFKAYRITNDLNFVINQISGYDQLTIKAALGAEVPVEWVQEKHGLNAQIKQGRLEIIDARETTSGNNEVPKDRVLLHTQVVDFYKSLKGLSMHLPDEEGATVFVRIYAILRKSVDTNAAPLIFTRDYAVSENDTGDAGMISGNALPPFANYNHAFYVTRNSFGYPVIHDPDNFTTGKAFPWVETQHHPFPPKDHLITKMARNANITYSGRMSNFFQEGGDPTIQAGTVVLKDGFHAFINPALPDKNLLIQSDRFVAPSGGNSRHSFHQPEICFYNELAASVARMASQKNTQEAEQPASVETATIGESQFSFWPNPTRDVLHVMAPAPGTLRLVDLTGIVLLTEKIGEAGMVSVPLPLLKTSIYVLQLQHAEGIISKKLMIE